MPASDYAVTGSNNPRKQVSVDRWNAVMGEIDGKDAGLRTDLADPDLGAGLAAVANPMAPANLTLLSDLLNGEPVSALRFISRTKHTAVLAGYNEETLGTAFTDMAGAFNAAGRGEIQFPRGHFNAEGQVAFNTGNLKIRGAGMGLTTLRQVSTGDQNGLRILKTTTTDDFTSLTYYNIAAALDPGATMIQLATVADAANFTAGGMAWVRCKQTITSPPNVNEPIAELVEIESVDAGTGVITLSFPLVKPYEADTSGTIFPFGIAPAGGNGAPLENIEIRDLTIDNAGEGYVLWLRHAFNALIENVHTKGRSGITTSAGGTNVTVRNCLVDIRNELPVRPYAFAVDKGAKHIRLEGTTFRCTGIAPIHIHEGIADFVMDGCRLLNGIHASAGQTFPWAAVNIAGFSWDVRITNNLFVNAPFAFIRASNAWSQYASDQTHLGLKINGNAFYGTCGLDGEVDWVGSGDSGIIINAAARDYEVDGNILNIDAPATGYDLITQNDTGNGRITNNYYRGRISYTNVVYTENNIPLDETAAGDRADLPKFRSYGATQPVGPAIESMEPGQQSPRIFLGNWADGVWNCIYSVGGTQLDFTTGGVFGSSVGTGRFRIDTAGINVPFAGGNIRINSQKLLGERKTGWARATGTMSRATFDTGTATATDVAQRLAALIEDLHASSGHGVIGT